MPSSPSVDASVYQKEFAWMAASREARLGAHLLLYAIAWLALVRGDAGICPNRLPHPLFIQRCPRRRLRLEGNPRMLPRGNSISLPIHVDLGAKGLTFERADIKFSGIEQAGQSFEGRVFLNNPEADLNTPATREHGYAGSFHVYGYGLWPGDIGTEPSERGAQQVTVRAPIEKVVIATEAVRAAASQSPEVVVTVV